MCVKVIVFLYSTYYITIECISNTEYTYAYDKNNLWQITAPKCAAKGKDAGFASGEEQTHAGKT